MIVRRKTKQGKVRYGVRVHRGGDRHEWLGTFEKLSDARAAERKALASTTARAPAPTCDDYARSYLEGYRARWKPSSAAAAEAALSGFIRDFEGVRLEEVTPQDAQRWASQHRWRVPQVQSMFSQAVRQRLIDYSPFAAARGPASKGRKEIAILTPEELDELARAAERAHRGDHGRTMRALVLFLAYSTMRPGEALALEWRDIDFEKLRIHVRRRSYKGHIDLPKSNKPREIVLPPPARDALLTLPRKDGLIFRGKRGQLIRQETLSGYWALVEVAFGREIDPYELRHFGAHHLYVRMNLPARVVAVQMGHSNPRLVEELYGHGEIGALEEIDRAFGANVRPLRRAGGAHGA